MGLARRLATGWPIGQPVANPSEIFLEQQTDSQTSKSPAIFPDQHQIHTTSGLTVRTGTGSVRAPCPISSGRLQDLDLMGQIGPRGSWTIHHHQHGDLRGGPHPDESSQRRMVLCRNESVVNPFPRIDDDQPQGGGRPLAQLHSPGSGSFFPEIK